MGARPVRHDPGTPRRFREASRVRPRSTGYRPGVLETYFAPWFGPDGQAAFYRQYRQLSPADTADYEHLLDTIDIPVTLLWGRDDQILPAPYGEWIEQRVTNEGLTWIDDAGQSTP